MFPSTCSSTAKQGATCLPSIWITALWQRRKNVQSVRFWPVVLILLSLHFLVNKTAHQALCFVESCVESTFSTAILAVFTVVEALKKSVTVFTLLCGECRLHLHEYYCMFFHLLRPRGVLTKNQK